MQHGSSRATVLVELPQDIVEKCRVEVWNFYNWGNPFQNFAVQTPFSVHYALLTPKVIFANVTFHQSWKFFKWV
jgi:hypothetical protein